SKRLANSYPEAVKALSEAYRESIRKTLADPAATGKLAESLDLGMQAAVAKIAIPSSAYVYIPAAEARRNIEAFLGIFLSFDAQSIGARLPGNDFYQVF
ncbi:MAG TPA: ABC transporter substrate-binding protein, partial [Rectinemataceae bacterium]|nr:ABC transporter substrate-binding protein [Rectinemataceae bacterium]